MEDNDKLEFDLWFTNSVSRIFLFSRASFDFSTGDERWLIWSNNLAAIYKRETGSGRMDLKASTATREAVNLGMDNNL